MRVGIFGSDEDPQCQAVAFELRRLGVEDVLISSEALDQGWPWSVLDGQTQYLRQGVDDVQAAYVRQIPAPYAPALVRDGELVLYEDWFSQYMQARERASAYVAWLLNLQHRGVFLANPPFAASVLQYKPHQLHVLSSLGARVPRTLISNDPLAVRSFQAEVKAVIFKPLMGGAVTRALDPEAMEQLELIAASPVIFQERVVGDDVRVMLVGDEVVSSVAIDTPEQQLDFRADPVYSSGQAGYVEVRLPASIEALCRRAARQCGLAFAGIDIKRTADGWVFLELNSSPIYLDVEVKLGHPITRALAHCLVEGAREPARAAAL